MKPVHFPERNIVFAKNQPEYLPLPAHVDQEHEGIVTSCWKMSLKERLKVLFSGRIYLQVFTFHRALQPQRVSVQKPNLKA